MKEETPAQNGGGMSRAAKKRAKKNKKKTNLILAAEERLQPEKKKVKVQDKIPDEKIKGSKFVEDAKESMDDSEVMKTDDKMTDGENGGEQAQDSAPSTDLPGIDKLSLEEILLRKDVQDEETKEFLESMASEQRASALFQAIIYPIPVSTFYKEYFEKKPLLVRAKNRKRYQGLLSLESIKETTKKEDLYYSRDLNLTKYTQDDAGVKRRLTLDKAPQTEEEEETGVLVNSKELWKNYHKGCTIRLLCPHKHAENVHALLSTLELELQCMVGANAYLTPPQASQGFAPHYDDIEAFCLQLQGQKRWKVYEPTLKLPRASSEDFSVEEVKKMTQAMDVTLEEGDLLYMPRGWIHQACTLKDADQHSLHLTVSAMQQWAWVDLLDMIMPEALEAAATSETSSSLRQGLPRGFLDYMGAMYTEPSDEKLPESLKKAGEEDELVNFRKMLQENFRVEAKKRIMKVAKQVRFSVVCQCFDFLSCKEANHSLFQSLFSRQPKWWMPRVISWPSDTCPNANLHR